MARHRTGQPSLLFFLLSCWLLPSRVVSAIHVTPNSPCSSLCMDSSTLDASDPNSSNTRNSDISCDDADFTRTDAGKKWTSCLTCLQNSTFSQGSESDQDWFFYNLRYNFGYCIFGFPNATDIGSSPCQTSTACGPLQPALEDGIPSGAGSRNQSEFDYCDVDGGVMTSVSYDKCLACVSVSGSTTVVSNALVALEAGCRQRPSPSLAVGLNDTIFATTIISITEASSTADAKSAKDDSAIPTTTVVAVSIASALAVAVAGCISYVIYRKKRRQRRAAAELSSGKADMFGASPGGIGGGGGGGGISGLDDPCSPGGMNYPMSAVSTGIGGLGWESDPPSAASTPHPTSASTLPGWEKTPVSALSPVYHADAVGALSAVPYYPPEKAPRSRSPLQLKVDMAAVADTRGTHPPPYGAEKTEKMEKDVIATPLSAHPPGQHRLHKLSALPQLTTSLPQAATRMVSPATLSAVSASTVQGVADGHRRHQRRQPSPMSASTASTFTHTPFAYGNMSAGSNVSPGYATPTSATALLPTTGVPPSPVVAMGAAPPPSFVLSPAAQLRQQMHASIASQMPGVHRQQSVGGAPPALSRSTSTVSQQPAQAAQAAQASQTNYFERQEMELLQQQKKSKKRSVRSRLMGQDEAEPSSPVTTKPIQVFFPGPPGKK